MTIVIITEKPDASRRISEALAEGKSLKVHTNEEKVTYYEFTRNGKKHIVVCAVGHLFNLAPKNRGWTYPVFDCEWKPSFEVRKDAAFSKKYFDVVASLVKSNSQYVVATDYDLEGSVIGYNILRFLAGKEDGKRMKFSTLTKEELIESYERMQPHLDFQQVESGLTRHELDWLWGINLTRALTLALKNYQKGFSILSTGRVQGPTLAMLLERELEIRKFKPTPFWEIQLHVEIDGTKAIAAYKKGKVWKKEEAEKILSECKGKDAVVEDIKKKKYKQSPPVPFNTTDLQSEAYAQFKFSPTQTLSIAESLYQAGIISYPRSSSQKLPPSVGYEKILKALSSIKTYAPFAEELLKSEKLVPKEGPKDDPAHPCFPPDARFSLNPNGDMSFEDLSNLVIEWKWDEEKKSYFGRLSKPVKILAFDCENNSIVNSVIVGCWKTPYRKNLVKIITASNESLELTGNHPIMVLDEKGIRFKEASKLKKHDIILSRQYDNIAEDRVLVNEEDFVKVFTNKQREIIAKYKAFLELVKKYKKSEILNKLKISDSTFYRWKNGIKPTIVKTIERAKSLGLLPLRLSDPKTIILSRLLGHIFGDGYIGCKKYSTKSDYPVTFFEAQEEDIIEIKRDIENLGLKCNKYRKAKGIYVLWSNDAILARILIALGAPTGEKTSQETPMPSWILNGPKRIKQEFLAAYFGSDMVKPRTHSKNKRDLRALTCLMYKDQKIGDKVFTFLNNVKKCLDDFGIESTVKLIDKRDTDKLVVELSIKNSRDNLIEFFNKIGYRYCKYKELLARKCLAFLLTRKILIKNRKEKMEIAKNLSKAGLSFSEIAKEINSSKYTVKGWLYYNKGQKEDHVSTKELPKFDDFDLFIPPGLTFQEVKEITAGRKVDFVFDLEIAKYHTFFVSGFLVHNCVYPTHEAPDLKKLTPQQKKLYDLIVRRFLSVFGQDATRESHTVIIDVNGHKFILVGKRTIDAGWTKYYEPYLATEEVILPEMKVGQKLKVLKVEQLAKETQPPARYSQGSIIKELEKRNLGTKATRAEILQTLYDRGYITGKSIQVTKLGEAVTKALKEYSPKILSEELTRKFEAEMDDVYNGKKKRAEVVEEAKNTLKEILEEFKANEKKIGKKLLEGLQEAREEERKLGKCPNCGSELRIIRSKKTGLFFVGCSGYPNCKTAYPLPHSAKIQATGKVCEKCNTPIVQVLRKGKRPFRMCLDPKCETKKEWNKKKLKK